MIAIPLQLDPVHYDLCIVLEDDGLERIKKYDPAEVVLAKLGMPWQALRIRNIVILYANTEEAKALMTAANKPEVVKNLRALSRGWEFRPKDWDNDAPYQQPGRN